MKVSVLFIAAMIAFASCTDDHRHYDQLKAINRSLEHSNALIAQKTREVAEAVKADSTKSAALLRIETVRKKSADVAKYIKSLRDGLGDLEKDKKVVTEVFVTKKRADELYKKLATYSKNLRDMFEDEEKYEVGSNLFDDLTVMNDFRTDDKDRSAMWIKMNFEDASNASVKALLNMLQNDVMIVESRLVDYYRGVAGSKW